jgi:hypothetical protein
MGKISCEAIADVVLNRREVYGIEIDSQIRELANRLSARAIFKLFDKLDDETELGILLPKFLENLPAESGHYTIRFEEQIDSDGREDEVEPTSLTPPKEHYLRLVFVNEDAAYYQFPLFPNMDTDYIMGGARKRSGSVQHIRLDLASPEALQEFTEECRRNPHFLRLEESTAEEFSQARSNPI